MVPTLYIGLVSYLVSAGYHMLGWIACLLITWGISFILSSFCRILSILMKLRVISLRVFVRIESSSDYNSQTKDEVESSVPAVEMKQ